VKHIHKRKRRYFSRQTPSFLDTTAVCVNEECGKRFTLFEQTKTYGSKYTHKLTRYCPSCGLYVKTPNANAWRNAIEYVNSNKGLIHNWIKESGVRAGEREELMSQVYEQFARSLMNFDSSRASMNTYLRNSFTFALRRHRYVKASDAYAVGVKVGVEYMAGVTATEGEWDGDEWW